VLPAGTYKQRSNDTDYPFRAHSAFAHLTGWASDSVPDSVLVFDPREGGDGHDVTLYLRERADRTTAEFYSDATIGEFWIGPRPALAGVAGELGLTTAPIEDFAATTATSFSTRTRN
jgi:Xaa-Pro aminopeptidase